MDFEAILKSLNDGAADAAAELQKRLSEGRLSDEQRKQAEKALDALGAAAAAGDALAEPQRRSAPGSAGFAGTIDGQTTEGPAEFRTQRGEKAYVLKPEHRFADLPFSGEATQDRLSIGKVCRALVTGSWRDAEAEQRAMSTGVNGYGGYLVPTMLSSNLIDAARAQSVCMRAGAVTVPLQSDNTTMARVATDPTYEVKSENDSFADGSVVFDKIEFTPKTVGVLIPCSRELAEDAPNFAQIMEQTLTRSFAAKLDYLGLQGPVTGGWPEGIVNWSGVNTTAISGALAWEDLVTGVEEVQTDNFEPTAIVLHPANWSALAQLLRNSEANNFSDAPSFLAPYTRYSSTNCPSSDAIIGDFSQLAFGIRTDVQIEASTEAGNAFAKHQVLVKLTCRVDIAAFNKLAFWVGTAIS